MKATADPSPSAQDDNALEGRFGSRDFGRLLQHKWKEHEGFTARYNCDRLIWFERHQDVQRAIAREKELKGWRRARKIALIESANPTWTDLSRDWYDCEPVDYRRALDRMNR